MFPEEEVIARAYELQEAVQRQDREAIDRILAPDYLLAAPSSPTENLDREAWIDAATGPFRQRSWRMLDPRVTIDGDTAVVSGRNEQDASYEGSSAHPFFFTTDIWVRRDGDWLLLARHAERLST